jgi:Kef-type K+ transport system membrane component KefB
MQQTHLLAFLGLCLLFSLLTGRGAAYIKVPVIIGYIITGAFFGPAILHFVGSVQVEQLGFINIITLSLIGFNIGSELRFK